MALRQEAYTFTSDDPGGLGNAIGEALELAFEAVFSGDAGGFALSVRGALFVYDHARRELITPTGAYPLPFAGADRIGLRIIADRGSVELFTDDGLFNCGLNAVLDPSRKTVELLYARECSISGSVYLLGL